MKHRTFWPVPTITAQVALPCGAQTFPRSYDSFAISPYVFVAGLFFGRFLFRCTGDCLAHEKIHLRNARREFLFRLRFHYLDCRLVASGRRMANAF